MLDIATASFNQSLTGLPEVEYIKNVETKMNASAILEDKTKENKKKKA
jgi:hypothetical protein